MSHEYHDNFHNVSGYAVIYVLYAFATQDSSLFSEILLLLYTKPNPSWGSGGMQFYE